MHSYSGHKTSVVWPPQSQQLYPLYSRLFHKIIIIIIIHNPIIDFSGNAQESTAVSRRDERFN